MWKGRGGSASDALLPAAGQGSWGACVEVDSDTEAVANEDFKLGCICCKKRAEVPATASVDWYYMAVPNTSFVQVHTPQLDPGAHLNPHPGAHLNPHAGAHLNPHPGAHLSC